MSNIDRVKAFIDTIHANDKTAILSFFCDDAIFHNIPMPPATGKMEVWNVLAGVHESCTDINWIVHHIAESNAGVVLTERSDYYCINGHWVAFKVMGCFEFRKGKISYWRDYFDLQQSLDQMKTSQSQIPPIAMRFENDC